MASDKAYLAFVLENIENAGAITSKMMFGEYSIFSDGKIFALLCDNQLFIKPTAAGRAFIGEVTEAPPYPSAKHYFLIGDRIEDREWLSELVRRTVAELPVPKPKKKKKKDKG